MATEVTIPQQQTGAAAPSACLITNLGWMLDHASHAFGSEVAGALAPLGLGQRGFCVLSAAVDAEYTQTQLAGMIGLDKTTMVVTVDELERLGLAERVPSPTDRRARVIKVTDAGRERLAEGQDIIQRVQANVLESLPDGERETFVNCLAQLVTGRLASPAECHPPLRRRELRA
ncbi:MAG TPA: MarR family winged helix-turn-helix transcriptional regulator [Solirubrobacteraceae bacterium]|jgi:DNA-binding MarR family transcriptional regulator|nr:MarR family winged helix-turn-helix transcriptional regulator [Solirubrobacteraceae bacterium]